MLSKFAVDFLKVSSIPSNFIMKNYRALLEDDRHLTITDRQGEMATLFTWSQQGNNSLCITTALDAKSLHVFPWQLPEEHRKNCVGVAFNFLNQYKEDANDLRKQIITGDENWINFYKLERKSASMVGEKRGSTERIQEWAVCWAGDVNGLLGLSCLGVRWIWS